MRHRAAPRATGRWVGAAVLLLHALALLLAWRVVVVPSSGPKQQTVMVQLAVDPVADQRLATPTPPKPPTPPAAGPAPNRRPTDAPIQPIKPEAPTRLAPQTNTAIGPDDAASEPRLDHAATQRAIRESARQSSLATQARDEQGANPLSTSAKLGNNIEQAAHGDCAKGEYAGAGMGLLSLPFLAAAALSGSCAR